MKIKSNKYHNTKVIYKGIKFDSKKERDRYIELKQLHSLGIIESLELQPKFLLLDTIHYKGKTYPKTYYKADFKYFDNEKGKYIVEDVKSPITAKDKVYRLKIKMLLTKYHDIDFVEVI
jgi:hypothetical protein|nr:MAG TPA: Endonuclease [Caudoviricetes sp.]